MGRAERKRARGEDDEGGAGPAASRAPPRVDDAQPRREGHSVDTVLAQGGFVGHRSSGPGGSSRSGGFLGDATGSIIPPIFPSTTYARDGSRGGYDLRCMPTPRRDVIADLVKHDDAARRSVISSSSEDDDDDETNETLSSRGLMYSRPDNPTYVQTESVMASLEGGEHAALFSSGMAAVAAVAEATLETGDRAAVPKHCYFAVRVFFQEWCARKGVDCVLYDCEVAGDLERAVRGSPGEATMCKLLWIETPSNPAWLVTDIRAAAAAAKRISPSVWVCCDATVLTPLVCRPLTLGADLVMHSATKYLNGHSDVVAGAVICRKPFRKAQSRTNAEKVYNARRYALWNKVLSARALSGAVLGAFEAWLLLRGLRTLHVRVRAQCATAAELARRLAKHPKVSSVCYPGLETHAGHAVARAQQSAPFPNSSNANEETTETVPKMFGGMLSVRCAGGKAAAVLTTALTKVWFPATSLGGVESLVEHRKTVEGPTSATPDDLLRLSVGLEHVDDLYADLANALEEAHERMGS